MENKRKFSKEEIEEIKKIVKQENEALRKRPLYRIGDIILSVLVYYFIARWVGIDDFSWVTQKNIFIIIVLFVLFLIGYKLYYRIIRHSSSGAIRTGITMAFIVSTMVIRNSPTHYNWIYFACLTLLCAGGICLERAIINYFCEKIYMSQKQQESLK